MEYTCSTKRSSLWILQNDNRRGITQPERNNSFNRKSSSLRYLFFFLFSCLFYTIFFSRIFFPVCLFTHIYICLSCLLFSEKSVFLILQLLLQSASSSSRRRVPRIYSFNNKTLCSNNTTGWYDISYHFFPRFFYKCLLLTMQFLYTTYTCIYVCMYIQKRERTLYNE